MKKLLTLLFICKAFSSFAQLSVLDSLNDLYKHSLTDSAKCYNLILIAKEFAKSNPDSSQKLAKSALQEAIRLKSKFLTIHAYITIG
jgi:hypothetical protein